MLKKFIKRIRYFKLINRADPFFKKNDSGNFLFKAPDLKTLTQWYSKEILFVSNQIDNLEEKNRIKCSCGKGCAECCKQAIFINPTEFEILKYNILKFDRSTKEEIKLKAERICDIVKKTTIPMQFSKVTAIKEQQSINQQYFEKDLMCPLLGVNNECLIYYIRPLVCVTFRNYGDRNECSSTCTPEFGHPYIYCDGKITLKMYNYYPPKSANYRLLASALNEILK